MEEDIRPSGTPPPLPTSLHPIRYSLTFSGRGSNGGRVAVSVKVLGGDQVVLLAVVVFTGIVTVQPVGQRRGERTAGG